MQDLELAIHHHQSLYEQVTQAYTEVSVSRRRILTTANRLLSNNIYTIMHFGTIFN